MKIRKSNFEIMRIISMLFIIIWHIILYGKYLHSASGSTLVYIKIILFLCVVHVNSFVILTGYFQSKSKFKLSKALSLVFQCIFYSFVIYIVMIKLGIITDYNKVSILKHLLPSTIGDYWFMAFYLVLYIFSDYINKFVDNLSKGEFKTFLIIGFIVLSIINSISGGSIVENTGYNFYHFIYLYMIGAYLRKYPLNKSYHFKNMSKSGYACLMLFGYFALAAIGFLVSWTANNIFGYDSFITEISNRVFYSEYNYASPIIVLQTICYFEFFKTIDFKNKHINFISKYVLGVYLLHDNPAVRSFLHDFLKSFHSNMHLGGFKYYFLVVVVIFISGIIFEMIRTLIVYLLNKLRLTKLIKNKLNNFIKSFNFNLNI